MDEAPRIDPVPEVGGRPRWSVMIPTFNCAGYLRHTLESVLAQDPGPEQMQIEVVDDCSTADDPERVVAEVGAGRVHFVRKARNEGPTRTFNACLQRARGHLVHILHGDDYVLPRFYAVVAAAAEQRPDVAFLHVRSLLVDEHGDLDSLSARAPSLEAGGGDASPFYYANPFRTPGVVIRRVLYERCGGFDPRLIHVADWEMWVRAIRHGGGLAINEPYAAYRVFAGNHTSQMARSGENIRDHLRMAAIWEAASLPMFSAAHFRRLMVRTTMFQMEWLAENGDRDSARRNRQLLWEISTWHDRLRYGARRVAFALGLRS